MTINDIEYNIRLYVDNDKTGEEITEELFEDFAQMNSFIERTWMQPEFEDAIAQYTFVEVVDGIPDEAGRYFFDIGVYMPIDDDDIEDVLNTMEVIIPQEQEELKKAFEHNQLFEPAITDNAPGDGSKEIPLSEYAYLCPKCLNELEKCNCHCYPYYTIQIDRLLVPVIKELNIKGYHTSQCCAGHPGYKETGVNSFVYVAFRESYHFPIEFPEDSKYRKEGESICFDIPREKIDWNVEDLKKYQRECIDKLYQWANSLPENK